MFFLVLLRQRCTTTTSDDREAVAIIDKEFSVQQHSSTAVGKLDTDETDVDKKRVQRSDGHFDLLGTQIFLYKGQKFAERSYRFFIS